MFDELEEDIINFSANNIYKICLMHIPLISRILFV